LHAFSPKTRTHTEKVFLSKVSISCLSIHEISHNITYQTPIGTHKKERFSTEQNKVIIECVSDVFYLSLNLLSNAKDRIENQTSWKIES
jgi:hypothetical protein